VKEGVPAKRLVAKGFGPDKPIADNTTPEGQEKNRRVEFNIVKQGSIKTLVQDE
jgi:outer membrane protein OmpA-like peptidoglycan-associated protein